jgi:ribulose-5-phosphate 4-epimerase/fuculose-1-phosphate aldolase
MKTYKFTVEIFVYAENETDAAANLTEELDYLCELDNNLQAFTHPTSGIKQTEEPTP